MFSPLLSLLLSFLSAVFFGQLTQLFLPGCLCVIPFCPTCVSPLMLCWLQRQLPRLLLLLRLRLRLLPCNLSPLFLRFSLFPAFTILIMFFPVPTTPLCSSVDNQQQQRPEQVKRALGLVQMMRSDGLAPTEITYNTLLRLCGLGGCWAMGMELMGMMEVSFFVDAMLAALAPGAAGLFCAVFVDPFPSCLLGVVGVSANDTLAFRRHARWSSGHRAYPFGEVVSPRWLGAIKPARKILSRGLTTDTAIFCVLSHARSPFRRCYSLLF